MRFAQSCPSNPRDNLFKSSKRIMPVKAFWKNMNCSLCIAVTWMFLCGFVKKKWVTAVFFRLVVLFLLIFANNHFFKSNGSVWRQARFQNLDASEKENLCKYIFISKDYRCYCEWLVKLLQNIHADVNNVMVHCSVKNSQIRLLPLHLPYFEVVCFLMNSRLRIMQAAIYSAGCIIQSA